MDAVKNLGYFNHFQWIGSDGWSSRAVVTKNKERVVEGTLSLQPRAGDVKGFDRYFRSLRPPNSRNPWYEFFDFPVCPHSSNRPSLTVEYV